MVQTCQKCSRVNPADASYCYFDGAVLNGHAGGAALLTSGKQNFPREFVFPSGKAVRNFDQLARACQEDWSGTLDLLQQGYLERFLGETGRADLALAAREAARFPDRNRGLDQFLAKLPTDVLEPPKLYAEPSDVNLGQLQVGDDRHLELKLANQGSRLLYGSVTSDAKWLTVGDAPSKLFQFGDEATLPVHIRGKDLRASNKPLEGRLSIESNGGVVTTTVRAEVPIKPFKEGVLAGATSPRQVAEKAKAKPKEAAPLFENGAVGKWYKDNGWTYPVQGPATSGLAAVAQFFEALGLARPPKVEISERSVRLRGGPGEKLKHFLKIESQEKRPVYAHGSSDSPWVEVGRAQLQGRSATVAVVVPMVPNQPGETLQARVTVTSNGNQQFVVPVTLEVSGQRMASADVVPIMPGQAGYAAAVPLAPMVGQDGGPPIAVVPGGSRRKGGGFLSANLHLWPAVLLALLLGGFFVRDLFVGNKPPPTLLDTNPRIKLQFHKELILNEPKATPDGPPPTRKDDPLTTGLTIPTMRFCLFKMPDPKDPQVDQVEKRLTYDKWGRSNNTCLRIDGTEQVLVGLPPGSWKEIKGGLGKAKFLVKGEPVELDREGYRSVWLINEGKIQVTQTAEVVPGSQSHLLDTCLVRYQIENTDSRTHQVGIRFLLDTFIGTNDGVPFIIPGDEKLSDTLREFRTEKEVPDFIQALEKPNLDDPGTVARVTLKTKGLESPSRVLLGAWPDPHLHELDQRAIGHMTLWDVPLFSMNDKALKKPDSGVTIYWDEKDLKAREKREVGFAYGLGTISKGRIRLTIGGSFEPGGTLTVTALVNDPKPGERVTLEVPRDVGFKVQGDATQPVPEATAGRNYSPVTWKIRAGSEDGDFVLKVRSTTGGGGSETVTLQSGRNIFD